MLKRLMMVRGCIPPAQPPSGGCVLKHLLCVCLFVGVGQPPSGGCVLKPSLCRKYGNNKMPAAFRRLCVETIGQNHEIRFRFPAAFRRLCVETSSIADIIGKPKTSRLQAAVC